MVEELLVARHSTHVQDHAMPVGEVWPAYPVHRAGTRRQTGISRKWSSPSMAGGTGCGVRGAAWRHGRHAGAKAARPARGQAPDPQAAQEERARAAGVVARLTFGCARDSGRNSPGLLNSDCPNLRAHLCDRRGGTAFTSTKMGSIYPTLRCRRASQALHLSGCGTTYKASDANRAHDDTKLSAPPG